MKRLLLLLAILMSTMQLQAAPDRDRPEIDFDAISDSMTRPGAYAALAKEFAEADLLDDAGEINYAAISDPRWTFLYYGTPLQPNYKGSFDMIDSPVKELLKSNDLERAWAQGVKYLKEYPASLTTYADLVECGVRMERPADEVMSYMARMSALVLAIMESGNGQFMQTACKVIAVGDEYVILRNVLEAKIHSRSLVFGGTDNKTPFDVFSVEWDESGKQEMWFDVALPMLHTKKVLDQQEQREDDAMDRAVEEKNGKKKRN